MGSSALNDQGKAWSVKQLRWPSSVCCCSVSCRSPLMPKRAAAFRPRRDHVLTPSDPVMGGSVDISVMLYNSQQSDAFNVDVAFYKENIAQTTACFSTK